MASKQSWFHGYTAWYTRAVVWFLEVLLVGALLQTLLGTLGVVVTGLVGALLLFRHVERHVQQELNQ
ncbi:hypothetical protein SAMN04487950_3656 [Halogranum rubrum]|uniref:Uncharacterized protein n=2 Tax=Halogranum rubrum TaxID=553466 RepID=A0A1I4HD27_9EURY|nr:MULTISPECIES: hypothetical protein [Halogranum]EJN59921.1 hypothetical protein HSB1_20790 [Halogranum salarium B-1]SFL40094.1 hypothetical protein SAMN04487950_3656 [Halogranum rubrum]